MAWDDLKTALDERLARAIAALPDRSPSAAFVARIMAVLQREPFPAWARWLIGAYASLIACGATTLALWLASQLTLAKALAACELLARPGRLAPMAAERLARLGLLASRLWASSRALGLLLGPWPCDLPLQLAAASAIVLVFLTRISNTNWRTP